MNILKDMFTDGHETKVKDNPPNENFAKKEFQALWRQINHKHPGFPRIHTSLALTIQPEPIRNVEFN